MNVLAPAAPRAGRSLEGVVAPLRDQVGHAVAIARGLIKSPFDWLIDASAGDLIAEADWRERSAWASVAIVLIDAALTGQKVDAARAFGWFGMQAAGGDWSALEARLAPVAAHADMLALLPYLLDTYGRTTRLNVLRDEGLGAARTRRKQVGSFYTPADVVDFMVGAIASAPGTSDHAQEHWLDPACGSGVFLTGVLARRLATGEDGARSFARSRLHGCDIVPQACDFAAFAIFAMVAGEGPGQMALWRDIRRNFKALDALAAPSGSANLRQTLGLADVTLRLICNPPYVSGGKPAQLADGYPTRSLYLPFVDMAWQLAGNKQDAASLVVPLALGANRSADHRRCRAALSRAGGEWTMLFFDRQPHALFGEEAKTRATIAVRRPGPIPAEIRTSRMLKWTSRQRHTIFAEDRAVSMGQADIGRLIPKLGSADEAGLYRQLDTFRLQAGSRPALGRAEAADIVGTSLSSDVFVAGTAYNFLNVFRNYPDQLSGRGTLSASGIHRLHCGSFEEAEIVTAVLTSRLAFWLWHAECDGFHVPAWFLSELPLLNLRVGPKDASALAALGRAAWQGVQQDVVTSVNRGRMTFAFRPSTISEVRGAIDRILLGLIGAEPDLAEMLADFEQRVVSIDGSVRRARPNTPRGDHK